MLNQTGVTKVSAGTRKTILYDTKVFFALSCKVSGTPNATILAGMPLKGNLEDRDTAMQVAGSSDTPIGILEHDIKLNKDGEANAAILIFGFVDTDKLDASVNSVLNTTMKGKLPKITFCK